MSRERASAKWVLALALAASALALGCDDAAERQARSEVRARAAQRVEALAAQQAAERAAAAASRLDQEKQAEATREAAALAKTRGALGTCCQALAQRGFEQRSMKDMDAKRTCLEAEGRGDSLLAVRPALTQALEDRELPPACVGN